MDRRHTEGIAYGISQEITYEGARIISFRDVGQSYTTKE